MNVRYGWTGRIAMVDLDNTQVNIEYPPKEIYECYIGGRGFGAYYLKKIEIETGPLSSGSILIFSTGPLTGTNLPASSRASVGHLSVIHGGYSWANVGGSFGAALKYAGFDCIVVKGSAAEPVYLLINDGTINVRQGKDLWGLDINQTEKEIRRELTGTSLSIAAIGPAGENLAKQACIIVDQGRAAAWGGCGAVMGSKKLKAVVVDYAKGHVAVANPGEFKKLSCNVWERAKNSKPINCLRRYGTIGTYGVGGIDSSTPQAWRNHQDEYWDANKYIKLKEVVFREKYETKRLSCFNCPVACSHLYVIKKGNHAGTFCEGIQANTIRGFGSNLDVNEAETVVCANALCNRLGLDIDGVSTALGWAFESYQRGVLSKEEAGGLDLTWGNGEAALILINQIAFRQGLGDLLAEGVAEAAKKLGRGSEAWAVTVKKVGMNEGGVRSHKGWALGIMTSTRGGGHLSGSPASELAGLPPELAEEMFGVKTAGNPLSYKGKGQLVAWLERFKALVDMMSICYFLTWWQGDKQLIGPNDLAELFREATGVEISMNKLYTCAEHLLNLEKALNTLHGGFSRKDDQPHPRLSEIQISTGPFGGEYLDGENWQSMLDEYYLAHGWDTETGWQGNDILQKFDLQDLSARLQSIERLAHGKRG
ncbi:MAG: aldehyde ferredoxin oxidoreductase C-terminal domain-containing protein [Bacillota bacterium]